MTFCEHDNIDIAYKCMDCQEKELEAEEERFVIWSEPVEEYYWPEKLDALEAL